MSVDSQAESSLCKGSEACQATTHGASGWTLIMVVTGRGQDKPGIVNAFLGAVAAHSGKVLDMAQFLLDGSLVLNMRMEVDSRCSMTLMTVLLQTARPWRLELDFHFPASGTSDQSLSSPSSSSVSGQTSSGATGQPALFHTVSQEFRAGGESMAALTIASRKEITPALLHGLDVVLCEHGCTVLEIEHRSDDKIENNGEINKAQMKISCPVGLTLATLYIGDETGRSLQAVADANNAVVTVRWWDSKDRPNGKSLVVFGLSGVLCPYDVLQDLLEVAGADEEDPRSPRSPKCTPKDYRATGLIQRHTQKVLRLAGKSVEAMQQVKDQFVFTPGAKLVCSALRSMGCRLCILSSTGTSEIGEHCKQHLGIDHVECQDLEVRDGKFTGYYKDDVETSTRKSDVLKKIADREGIDYKNIIVVGEYLRGLSTANARSVLETFGLNINFDADTCEDLSILLYLLGFSGSNVRVLRNRFDPESSLVNTPIPGLLSPKFTSDCEKEVKRFIIEVSTRKREPGLIRDIVAPLLPPGAEASIATVRQCSLHDGGMCLGMDLRSSGKDPAIVAKELLYACNVNNYQTRMKEPREMPTKTPSMSMQHYLENRYCITIVQQPYITCTSLKTIVACMATRSVNINAMERLSAQQYLSALQLTVGLRGRDSVDDAVFSLELLRAGQEQGADVAIQKDDVDRFLRRIVVFAMDTTLVQQDVSILIAQLAGVEKEMREILLALSEERITFLDSLKARAALLKGRVADELFAKVKEKISLTPGAKRLCRTLKKLGYKTAVISSSFLPIVHEVQHQLELDYSFGNAMEVDESTGFFTGETTGSLVTPEQKQELLVTMANMEGCEVRQTVAVGDGSKDAPMLATAGLGISFCAKPKENATNLTATHTDLSLVLYLLGLSEHAVERHAGSGLSTVHEAEDCTSD